MFFARHVRCHSALVGPRMFWLSRVVVLAGFVIFSPLAVLAADAGDDKLDAELAAAKAHFAREKAADTWWYYGWISFSGAILATSTTLYLTTEPQTRIHKAQPISMAVSGVGGATMILFKPKSFLADAELSQMAEATPEQKKAKLKKSEEWLAVAAKRQSFTTGLFAQFSTVTFLGLAAGIDALWFNGPWFALLRFVTSLTIAEIKIFTQPTYSRDRYERRNKSEPFQWQVRMLPGEIAVVAYF
jgi:hypothetical protein